METNISILISKNISYVNYDANSAIWNQIYSGQIWMSAYWLKYLFTIFPPLKIMVPHIWEIPE